MERFLLACRSADGQQAYGLSLSVWVVLALGSDAIFGNLEEGLFGMFYFIVENG